MLVTGNHFFSKKRIAAQYFQTDRYDLVMKTTIFLKRPPKAESIESSLTKFKEGSFKLRDKETNAKKTHQHSLAINILMPIVVMHIINEQNE